MGKAVQIISLIGVFLGAFLALLGFNHVGLGIWLFVNSVILVAVSSVTYLDGPKNEASLHAYNPAKGESRGS